MGASEVDGAVVEASEGPRKAVRLTERDRQIVGLVCELGVVPREALSVAWSWSRQARDRRLAVLEAEGLIGSIRLASEEPGALVATSAGADLVGSELPPGQVTLASWEHTVAVGMLGARLFAAGVALDHLVSERRMRVAERAGRGRWSIEVGSRWHRGDLAALRTDDPDGPAVVFEIERTPKSVARLASILRAWTVEPRIDAVVYLATPSTIRRIDRAIADADAQDRVFARPLPARADDGAWTKTVAWAARAVVPS